MSCASTFVKSTFFLKLFPASVLILSQEYFAQCFECGNPILQVQPPSPMAYRGPMRRGYKRPAYGRPLYKARFSAKRYKRSFRGRSRGTPSRRQANPRMPVIPALSCPGVPMRCRARMRFAFYTRNEVAAEGKMSQLPFRANSPLDCASGSQRDAMGFTELAAIYNRFEVVGSKIRVDSVPGDSTTGGTPASISGVYVQDNQTLDADYLGYQTIIEARRGQWTLQQIQEPYKKTLMGRWSARKWFSSTLSGTTTNSGRITPTVTQPADVVWYILWAQAADQESDLLEGAYQWVVTIDYIVDWFEPREIGPSFLTDTAVDFP